MYVCECFERIACLICPGSERESFRLDSSLPEAALDILLKYGLAARAPPDVVKDFKDYRSSVEQNIGKKQKQQEQQMESEFEKQNPALVRALSAEMARIVLEGYR